MHNSLSPDFRARRHLLKRAMNTGVLCACGASIVAADEALDPALSAGCTLFESSKFSSAFSSAKQSSNRIADQTASHNNLFMLNGVAYVLDPSSGDRQFDRALAESLFFMSELFGVTPTFAFIKNATTPNAYATSKPFRTARDNPVLPGRADGTVLLADSIIGWMKSKGIDDPVAATLAICAHEFGHIAQFKYRHQNEKVSSILRAGEPGVKRLELHADFLSGYYIGVARHRNPQTPSASVAFAAYVTGDNRVTSFTHHGTPEERGQAVVAGYHQGYEQRSTFNDALVEGLRYVGAID